MRGKIQHSSYRKPPIPEGQGEEKEKTKDSARAIDGEVVHFVSSQIICLDSPPRLAEKDTTFLCSMFGMCVPELWSIHSSPLLMW